jgi:hypothetical protein
VGAFPSQSTTTHPWESLGAGPTSTRHQEAFAERAAGRVWGGWRLPTLSVVRPAIIEERPEASVPRLDHDWLQDCSPLITCGRGLRFQDFRTACSM